MQDSSFSVTPTLRDVLTAVAGVALFRFDALLVLNRFRARTGFALPETRAWDLPFPPS